MNKTIILVMAFAVVGCESLKRDLKANWEYAECMSQFAGHGYMASKGLGINTTERPNERHCKWRTSEKGKKYFADEEKRLAEVRNRKLNKILKKMFEDAEARKEQRNWEQGGEIDE